VKFIDLTFQWNFSFYIHFVALAALRSKYLLFLMILHHFKLLLENGKSV